MQTSSLRLVLYNLILYPSLHLNAPQQRFRRGVDDINCRDSLHNLAAPNPATVGGAYVIDVTDGCYGYQHDAGVDVTDRLVVEAAEVL